MKLHVGLTLVILCMGLFSQSVGFLGGDTSSVVEDGSGRVGARHLVLNDAVPSTEYYGVTQTPACDALDIQISDDPQFVYMSTSPYYTAYFKGAVMKMVLHDVWVSVELKSGMGDISTGEPSAAENVLTVAHICEDVDAVYTIETSLLTQGYTLDQFKDIDRIIEEISWEGMEPETREDGSIVFKEGDNDVLVIFPPFMKDAKGAVCNDLHYELIETETGYELHKVIDEGGLTWLKNAVYPVVIDPSMGTIEDAWQNSGLTPYGQYFRNLREYVNPVNGYLTITQTDLAIPGRGLDVVIERVYETPAVFYGSSPYDYEAPPVDMGKGWQLDFPYVGTKYLHLWGGTLYKISWVGSQFENHRGVHFILVKNQDNTYTLTMANGMVCEFNTSGKLTAMKDADLNTITFNYTGGVLTSITDTIGRTISLTYSGNRLQKITYNNAEIEYSYDGNGCLQWMDDFLNRRTSYSYNTGYNYWLLSNVEYTTTGYATYAYNRVSDGDYYKYYVTDQRVYETNQVRHIVFSYTGTFGSITSSTATVKNESDLTQGSYSSAISDGLITEQVVKNASGTAIRKHTSTYNSLNQITQTSVYANGSTFSYTSYYAYDNWGNVIYMKNGEGHEQFLSYANTSTSGFFVDKDGNIIRTFTNAFSNSNVPSSIHTVLLGIAEKQDQTYVREVYLSYDSEAHPTQSESSFGNSTTYLTFSGTFNEKTGDTSFPIDLTGHTVAGNAVLQVTGLASDDIYTETHSYTPNYQCEHATATWKYCYWANSYFNTTYLYNCEDLIWGQASIGPFTHAPGTLGYISYSTTPSCNGQAYTFTVNTTWRAYPAQVQYKVDGESYKTVTTNLANTTARMTVPMTDGSHTLYFSESSPQNTKFSWYLYVPVDNTPATYTTSLQYDVYGNVTSITDAESNTVNFAYSSSYSYAYLTEVSTTVGSDTITTRATYDYYRGWITSTQEPKGVAASGYDYLYTYDLLGRVTKKEFPLLSGQSERAYVEAVYDDTNRTVTLIDPLRHYMAKQVDKLGRLTSIKSYTGTYGSGTLYATTSYTYQYNDLVSSVTDFGSHQTTCSYDFLGRVTQITLPDSSSVSYTYDDANNKVTFTNARGYDRIYWFDWLSRLEKVEEEYAAETFAVTMYQYNEVGCLTSFTDAENHSTTYTYASLFGLTKTTYADSTYEQYAYDDVGDVTIFTDAKGNDTTFTYDNAYRLTQIQYEDSSTVSFTYDLNSNRTRMTDNALSTGDYVEYAYDTWNRLLSETRHISTDSYAVSYQYDTANRVTKLTYPDTMQILYSYDDLNRMTEIKRYVDGSNDEVLMDGIQYNTESLLTQFDYGNDLRATFSYDSRHRISTIDVKDGQTSFLGLDFTFDNNTNITQLVNGWRDTDSDWHSETESYSYDRLDRLTSASCNSWSHAYSYDKVGNRMAKDSVMYTINTVNEVTALSDDTSFTYDDNGNRTQKSKGTDTWVYTYDCANRLTKVEKNSTTVGEYIYDGGGKRIQVTEEGVTKTYIYARMIPVYEKTSSGHADYIYGPTGRIAKRTTMNSESHTYYYHDDHLGSTRLVTDESKNIIAAATYEPFGEASVKEGEEDYLFNGKEKDITGLYYYGARYYDPEVGRFCTRDPLSGNGEIPQSLNRYAYCLNNPMKYIDPFGLKVQDIDIIVVYTVDGATLYVENGKITHGVTKDGKIITKEQLDALNKKYQEAKEKKDIIAMYECLKELMDLFGIPYTVDEKGNLYYRGFRIALTNNPNYYGYCDPTYRFKWGAISGKIVLDYSDIEDIGGLYMVLRHEMKHVDLLLDKDPFYELDKHWAEEEANKAMIDAYEELVNLGFETSNMRLLYKRARSSLNTKHR